MPDSDGPLARRCCPEHPASPGRVDQTIAHQRCVVKRCRDEASTVASAVFEPRGHALWQRALVERFGETRSGLRSDFDGAVVSNAIRSMAGTQATFRALAA